MSALERLVLAGDFLAPRNDRARRDSPNQSTHPVYRWISLTASAPFQSFGFSSGQSSAADFSNQMFEPCFSIKSAVLRTICASSMACPSRHKTRESARPRCAGAKCTSQAALHRTLDAVLAPVGNPCDTCQFPPARAVPKLVMINFDEPLVHRPKNNWCLAAPAMRVAMMIILLVQQRLDATAIRAAPPRSRRSCRAFPASISRPSHPASVAPPANHSVCASFPSSSTGE